MNNIILEMLKPYNCKKTSDYKNALKEIIQEIALLGLSRHGFFDHAAFYGGSALRIFQFTCKKNKLIQHFIIKNSSSEN